ncbi:hypothetical protein CYY_006070 [Polysphondylium violaceum]|uniref:Uncharacterized protein n=1 Tax=Polysphondylium violaceum TaxID=133409 RepID=A0A8J4Q165_9MYCE|nr:hypothetical protein CYY_006070 [Polysphondylium violaceum]
MKTGNYPNYPTEFAMFDGDENVGSASDNFHYESRDEIDAMFDKDNKFRSHSGSLRLNGDLYYINTIFTDGRNRFIKSLSMKEREDGSMSAIVSYKYFYKIDGANNVVHLVGYYYKSPPDFERVKQIYRSAAITIAGIGKNVGGSYCNKV